MSLLEWQSQLGQLWLCPHPPASKNCDALSGVPQERLRLYEELMENTVLETLQSIYPYSYRLISRNGKREAEWETLAWQYRRAYPNRSYKLMGAVCFFSDFIAKQSELITLYPYLSDLARYEWLEMLVLNKENNLPDNESAMADKFLPEPENFFRYRPVWNQARQLETLQYPIPEILDRLNESDFSQDAVSKLKKISPKPIDVLIYRDPQNLEARFFCLNPLTTLLIQFSENPDIESVNPQSKEALEDVIGLSYEAILNQLTEIVPGLRDLPVETIRQQAYGLFQTCLSNGILSGSIKIS